MCDVCGVVCVMCMGIDNYRTIYISICIHSIYIYISITIYIYLTISIVIYTYNAVGATAQGTITARYVYGYVYVVIALPNSILPPPLYRYIIK